MQMAFDSCPEFLSTKDLVLTLVSANNAYRAGRPIMDDNTYDQVYLAELKRRAPNHPYLSAVEPEPEPSLPLGKVRHSKPMLSTDKAYNHQDLKGFVLRVNKAAEKIGIDINSVAFEITPKLDGIAASLSSGVLATRGDGLIGNDITFMLERGLVIKGEQHDGAGEIVIDIDYFKKNLASDYKNPRNFIAGIASADKLSPLAEQAFKDKAIHLVLFHSLDSFAIGKDRLLMEAEQIIEKVLSNCNYATDGTVISVLDSRIQQELGSTSHHHGWQIAKKSHGDTAIVSVENISWQVGRTGRITPVIHIEATELSGAVINKLTGHHAGHLLANKIGIGARIRIVRAGEVIPTYMYTFSEGEMPVVPDLCPCCRTGLTFDKDYLVCSNPSCEDQKVAQNLHFFETLGNVDLFGPQTVKTLVAGGFGDLDRIFTISLSDLMCLGFSEIQSNNLLRQLERARSDSVDDWRFLAAIGIPQLGRGDSRKLLEKYPLNSLDDLTETDLLAIHGFGAKTARSIAADLRLSNTKIKSLLNLGFNLRISSSVTGNVDSPINGKHVVFTGSMSQSRDGMKELARQLGAHVQSSVNTKTDILVIGERVGSKKINAAEANNTLVISESDYMAMLNS